jgi:hypothetical protein
MWLFLIVEIRKMARYYFHIQIGDTLATDDEGIDCPTVAAAKQEALASAREMLANAIKFDQPRVPDCFVIADASGREVLRVPVKDVLPPYLC